MFFRFNCVRFFLLQVIENDVCAFFCEGNGNGPADTAVAAGDNSDLVFKEAGSVIRSFAVVSGRIELAVAAGMTDFIFAGRAASGLLCVGLDCLCGVSFACSVENFGESPLQRLDGEIGVWVVATSGEKRNS